MSLLRLIVRALCAAAVVALLGVAVALATSGGSGGRGEGPQAEAEAIDGSLRTAERDGEIVFEASDLAPGATATGTVLITNRGRSNGLFWLSRIGFSDRPGAGGGSLSDRLQLTVLDVTLRNSPALVYSGGVVAMQARPLGFIAPGKSRIYSVAATFLPGEAPRPGGDPYSGASTSVPLVWRAIPGSPSAGRRAPGGDAKRPAAAPPDLQPPALSLEIPRRQSVIATGRLALKASCDERCVASAGGSMRVGRAFRLARSPGTSAGPGGAATLHVALPPAAHRAVRAALTEGRSAPVRLEVEARDEAGNRAALTRRIWLKPQP